MPAGGDSRPQRVPPIPPRPSHSIYPTLAMCSTGSTSPAGSPKASTLVRREIQRRDPQRRPPTFEPDLFRARFTLLRRADHLSRSPPGAPRQTVRRSSPSPHRVRMPSSRALPAIRSRQPEPGQPGARTVRRSLRHRTDTANTTKSWTPSSHGENRSWPTTPPDGYPTDPSKEPTTSTKSYDASPTGSPTPTITQPEESS